MITMRRRGLLALVPVALVAPAVATQVRAQSLRNIADTMAGDTRFSRILDIIVRASAQDRLREPGPMTVFAPVDAAFATGQTAILNDLFGGASGESGANSNPRDRERVVALLSYHIVPGSFSLNELGGSDRRIRTLNGADLQISGTGTDMTVRNPAPGQQISGFGSQGFNVTTPARVVGQAVTASNGVIIPIDQLLFP